jgi:hypothetical protein
MKILNMKSLLLNMKNWNWSIYVVILLVSICGSLSNKNYDNVHDAIICAFIFGNLFGLPFAWITKDEI